MNSVYTLIVNEFRKYEVSFPYKNYVRITKNTPTQFWACQIRYEKNYLTIHVLLILICIGLVRMPFILLERSPACI
jgi:hypothetical protein